MKADSVTLEAINRISIKPRGEQMIRIVPFDVFVSRLYNHAPPLVVSWGSKFYVIKDTDDKPRSGWIVFPDLDSAFACASMILSRS